MVSGAARGQALLGPRGPGGCPGQPGSHGEVALPVTRRVKSMYALIMMYVRMYVCMYVFVAVLGREYIPVYYML